MDSDFGQRHHMRTLIKHQAAQTASKNDFSHVQHPLVASALLYLCMCLCACGWVQFTYSSPQNDDGAVANKHLCSIWQPNKGLMKSHITMERRGEYCSPVKQWLVTLISHYSSHCGKDKQRQQPHPSVFLPCAMLQKRQTILLTVYRLGIALKLSKTKKQNFVFCRQSTDTRRQCNWLCEQGLMTAP